MLYTSDNRLMFEKETKILSNDVLAKTIYFSTTQKNQSKRKLSQWTHRKLELKVSHSNRCRGDHGEPFLWNRHSLQAILLCGNFWNPQLLGIQSCLQVKQSMTFSIFETILQNFVR